MDYLPAKFPARVRARDKLIQADAERLPGGIAFGKMCVQTVPRS